MAAKKPKTDRVIEILQESIKIRESRQIYHEPIFGGAYKQQGHVLKTLFPEYINLSNHSDLSRFTIISTITSKLIRYCNNFENGGHEDSLNDISVYCAMLRELDEIEKGAN